MSNLACFTMTTHQMLSSHVIQVANFECLTSPNFALSNYKTSYKIPSVRVYCFRSYQQKTSREVPPPCACWVRDFSERCYVKSVPVGGLFQNFKELARNYHHTSSSLSFSVSSFSSSDWSWRITSADIYNRL